MNAQKIKSLFGYFIAALMVPLAIATMIGMQPFSELIVNGSGVKISPWYTGGEVKQIIEHTGYQTLIHRPVFDGLLVDKREGFVQVVWTKTSALPETIQEEIDYDADGQVDFQVTLQPRSKTAQWKSYNAKALQLQGPYSIGEGTGVRVTLSK